MSLVPGYHQSMVVGFYKDSDGSGPYFLDADGNVSQGLPAKLFTDQNGDGPNSRLRVDPGQTSFFAGREFRTYREFSPAFTGNFVIKVVTPINCILQDLAFLLVDGELRAETVVGGTEGGVFSEALPMFPANTMTERPTPLYSPQVIPTAGGTHTGGTVLDVFRIKSTTGGGFGTSILGSTESARGVGPGTYYIRIALTAAVGIFKARWEERP